MGGSWQPRPLKICDRWSAESQKLTAPGRNILPPRKFPQGAADLPDHKRERGEGGRGEREEECVCERESVLPKEKKMCAGSQEERPVPPDTEPICLKPVAPTHMHTHTHTCTAK